MRPRSALTCLEELISKLEVLKPAFSPLVEDWTAACRFYHLTDGVCSVEESHSAGCLLQQSDDCRNSPRLHEAVHDGPAVQPYHADVCQCYCSKGCGVTQAETYGPGPQSNVASGNPANNTRDELEPN